MPGHAAAIVVATLALGANGILLPPGVNSIDDSLSFKATTTKGQLVRIPCSECAFSTKQQHAEGVGEADDAFRIEGGANHLLLNFTTSADGRRLELNGEEIYPGQRYHGRPIVHQVPDSDDRVKVPLEVTSSGMLMEHEQAVGEDGSALVPIKFRILGVEKQLVSVQAVKIDLLKTGDELLIMRLGVDEEGPAHPPFHRGPLGFRPRLGRPPHGGPPPEMTDAKECNMLPAPVCRFKQMLAANIAHMRHARPCPGRMGRPHIGSSPPHLAPHGEHPHSHHRRPPHHMGPWHGHRHGHHRGEHHWVGAFVRGFATVLVPVVAGISVGLGVSLLGLVLGRLVTFIWLKCARVERHVADEYLEEGKGLMLAEELHEGEALPAYEDAPPYEADAKVSY